jgi:hypothetical protein
MDCVSPHQVLDVELPLLVKPLVLTVTVYYLT